MRYMRSDQGHSGGQRINLRLLSNVMILHGWSDYIYHVGSAFDLHSICERGLIARGIGVREVTTDVLLCSN